MEADLRYIKRQKQKVKDKTKEDAQRKWKKRRIGILLNQNLTLESHWKDRHWCVLLCVHLSSRKQVIQKQEFKTKNRARKINYFGTIRGKRNRNIILEN